MERGRFLCMRTTVHINDPLFRQAKQFAAANDRTFTSLVEEGLKLVVDAPKQAKRKRVVLPVARETGGVLPGVDLNDSAGVLDIMDGLSCSVVVS